ncbi:MAG: flagellar FleN [Thauera sp.]|jgi:flagellar biosynthesis protein FlhG|nr:flagellar FleN [Thauera sp.]
MIDRRNDQAAGLRRLFRKTPPQVMVVYGSGRRGSEHVLHAARRLSPQSERVLIIDEAQGESSLGSLAGQGDGPDLLQLLDGRTMLADVLQALPGLFGRIPAAAAALALPLLDDGRRACLLEALRIFHRHVDVVLIHAEVATLGQCSPFVAATSRRILLAEASASGASEAYQTVKALAAAGTGSVPVAIGGARSPEDARAFYASLNALVHRHVGVPLAFLGEIEHDDLGFNLQRLEEAVAAPGQAFLRNFALQPERSHRRSS